MNNVMIGSFSLYQLFLYFFTYSFLGWCMEVAYATYRTNKFINRGFLNGPVCPIYGTGLIIVLLALTPISAHPLLLFICSIILTTLLELVTGFVLERFFNTKWWDYSIQKWNFKGYICVKFSFLWGIACLIVIYIFHPIIANILAKIPYKIGLIVVILCIVTMVIDFVFTVLQMIHYGKIIKEMREFATALHKTSDKLGQAISNKTLAGMEKYDELKTKLEKTRLVKAFPTLKKEITEHVQKYKKEGSNK